MIETTHDDFLGGQVKLYQPAHGYRAGIDPVLLAASVSAKAGQSVLDIGCGVGTAALCLGQRVPGLQVFGVEVNADYADLARRNGQENRQKFSVHAGSFGDNPFSDMQFDHAMMNPPFFLQGTPSQDDGRDAGRHENVPMAEWIAYTRRRVRVKGQLTIIQNASRLDDILAGLMDGFGAVKICPIAPRQGRIAKLVLVQATKSSRADLKILPPLPLHAGEMHRQDAKDYTDQIEGVLRNGQSLPVFG